MKLGKRRSDDDPADEPLAVADADAPSGAVTATWTVPVSDPEPDVGPVADEPAVDSDAVELPPVPEPGPAVAPVPPEPLTIAEPAPAAPARPASRVATAPPVARDPAIAMSGATPADGHAPADPLMDELRILAADRPEIVVGAAFAGGILAAMILRRLGN